MKPVDETIRGWPGRSLSPAEVVTLAQQISGLAQARLPLSAGFSYMAEEVASAGLQHVLWDVSERLDRGEPLESAIQGQGRRIPRHLGGLVLAGLRTGRIGEVLEQFVSFSQVGTELRRRLWLGLVYPIVLLTASLGLVSFIMGVLVPRFKAIFMDFGVDLPDVSLVLIAMSDWLVDYAPFFLALLLATLVGGWFVSGVLLGAAGRRRLLYHVPWFGPMWRWTSLAEFAHLLGLLVESGVPLPEALELTADGVGDAEIADRSREIARGVAAGQSLADSISRTSRLPASLSASVRWGEGHQALGESLHAAGEMFEGQARHHATYVTATAPVLTVTFILTALGFIVIGLFLPLTKLITELSG